MVGSVHLRVDSSVIELAKSQIAAFEKIEKGKWRYSGVEAWRGIVCELLVSGWLSRRYNISSEAKGIDDSGLEDYYDVIINGKTVEIKSATRHFYKSIMPKVFDVNVNPKDFYVAAKYLDNVYPNVVEVIGILTAEEIRRYDIQQNKGAKYYNVPQSAFRKMDENTFL